MDSRFCSLTACLKNKKKYKIQIAFLDVMEKYKKNTKMQSVFVCILFVCFCIFTKNNTKKIQKIRRQLLKNTKYKKNTNQQFQKYKIQKKNTNPKFQKYKIQRKDKFKNKPESQPRVHFWKSGTKIQKKIQNQPVVFSKPCSSDFVFLGCMFFVFFVFLNIGGRPFCSHRGQLKYKDKSTILDGNKK